MKSTLLGLLGLIPLATPLATIAQLAYTSDGSAITITGYLGHDMYVTIPATIAGLPVTTIGNSAFSGRTGVSGVTIPSSVTSIGDYAFGGSGLDCADQLGITIPGSVTNIGNYAYQGCGCLTSVTIPASVAHIGTGAFTDCASLGAISVDAANAFYGSADGVLFNKNGTALIQCPGGKTGSFTIPGSVTNIEENAFADCTSLGAISVDAANPFYGSADGVLFNKNGTALIQCPGGKTGSYSIPVSVTNIEENAFADCTSLTNITIPGSVTDIGGESFVGCTRLTSVTISNGVTSIGSGAFYSCTSLANFTIPGSVTSIGANAFWNCTNLASVTISNGVTSIGSGAFYSCTSLANFTIPGSVTSIGANAFWNCTNLASVTISNGVTSIGSGAFYSCTSLASVTIPSSVTNLDLPFAYCSSLVAISVDAANAAYSSSDGVLFDKRQTTLIEYPAAKAGTYSIPVSVTNIGIVAFLYCASLTSVTIPNSVASIGRSAFVGCYSLTNVTIPDSVTSIGDSAFELCWNLEGIFFKGNAPGVVGSGVMEYTSATVYYLPGTTGWGATFGGRPTALWNPLMQASGVGPAGFGFDIAGTANIPIVIEAASGLANANWVPLQSLSLTNGAFHFGDPNWTNYPARLYRIRSP